jgi:DNA-directed RNA polymerase subunit RPC12/RpoP
VSTTGNEERHPFELGIFPPKLGILSLDGLKFHLQIEDGEVVKVSTPDGRFLQMKVKYSSRLVLGVMTAPYPSPLIDEKGITSIKIKNLLVGKRFMPAKKQKEIKRTCIDCGKDISNLHHNALRCKNCSKLRKQTQDKARHKIEKEKN